MLFLIYTKFYLIFIFAQLILLKENSLIVDQYKTEFPFKTVGIRITSPLFEEISTFIKRLYRSLRVFISVFQSHRVFGKLKVRHVLIRVCSDLIAFAVSFG